MFVFINIAKHEVCTPLSNNSFARRGHESQTRALQASLAPSASDSGNEDANWNYIKSLLGPHCPLELFPDYICLPFNPVRKGILNLGTVEIVVCIVLSVGLSCVL